MSRNEQREFFGPFLGLVVFLVGIGLLGLTFAMAYNLFSTPPDQALGLEPGKPLNINDAGRSGIAILYRVLMLLVMCIISSLIASRGIKLYGALRRTLDPVNEAPTPAPEADEKSA
ncbi:MAG TPA: hypothetical protein PLO61_08510 [Fimbriimonadaceae bacterium]|nr:hypothetical protein [Fimbriimonadaceae bacterium]HRJ33555.1 hypothetical protein [Fimbriimonadaceae bacterium]